MTLAFIFLDTAEEYLDPLFKLEDMCKVRQEVAGNVEYEKYFYNFTNVPIYVKTFSLFKFLLDILKECKVSVKVIHQSM